MRIKANYKNMLIIIHLRESSTANNLQGRGNLRLVLNQSIHLAQLVTKLNIDHIRLSLTRCLSQYIQYEIITGEFRKYSVLIEIQTSVDPVNTCLRSIAWSETEFRVYFPSFLPLMSLFSMLERYDEVFYWEFIEFFCRMMIDTRIRQTNITRCLFVLDVII